MSRENDKSWGNFTPRNYGNAQCGNNLVFKSANMLSNMPDNCIVSLRNGSDTVRGDFGGIRIFDGGEEKTYFKIKLFRDDDITNPINNPETHAYFRFEALQYVGFWHEVIVISVYTPESFYKRDSSGARLQKNGADVHVYNSEKNVLELDSYLYDSSYPTHPVKPPYMEGGIYHPAEYWDGTKYVKTQQEGMGLHCACDDSLGATYRTLSAADIELKKWPRYIVYPTLTNSDMFIKPRNIAMVLPYLDYSLGATVPPKAIYSGGIYGWKLNTNETIRLVSTIICSIPFTETYSAVAVHEPYYGTNVTVISDNSEFNIASSERLLNESLTASLKTSVTIGELLSFGVTLTNFGPEHYFVGGYSGGTYYNANVGIAFSYGTTYEYSTWHLGEDPPSF